MSILLTSHHQRAHPQALVYNDSGGIAGIHFAAQHREYPCRGTGFPSYRCHQAPMLNVRTIAGQ